MFEAQSCQLCLKTENTGFDVVVLDSYIFDGLHESKEVNITNVLLDSNGDP